MKFAITSSVLVFTSVVFGQVNSPLLGLVPDNGTIRPLRGIAAAGNVGAALDTGSALGLVEPAPSQAFALVTSADSGQVSLVALSADGITTSSTPVSVTASPDKIVFSPNGVAAALWYSSDQHVEIVSGLPQTPAVRSVPAAFLNGGLTALAVSDDAQWLALAGPSFVDAIGSSGAPISLPVSGTPEAVAFFHSSSSIAVITNLEVVTFADPGGAATRTQVWSSPPGAPPNPQTAVGFGLTTDNSHLTVTGNLGGVETFDLSNNDGTYTVCGCTPTALAHLGGSLFRLTGTESGPVKLYDASTAEILFVPASAPRILHPSLGPTARSTAASSTGAQTE